MRGILPGRPRSGLQALATGFWGSRQYTVYITGNAFAILDGPEQLVQTVYDEDEAALLAVAFDEFSGKIATCTKSAVRVYKPLGHAEDALKWGLQSSFLIQTSETDPCLSWGASEELLVAASTLRLYLTTSAAPSCFWEKALPNDAKSAQLSFDSAYIAVIGFYDTIVKVWRRLTYGADEVCFDLACLPHPDLVTNIRWRKPYHTEQTIDNILYTTCTDFVLRIWTGSDSHSNQQLHLWAQVDLAWSVEGQALRSASKLSSAPALFILDGREVAAAAEKAVQGRPSGEQLPEAAVQRLIGVANRNPEFCFVLGDGDTISALALENVGSRSQKLKVTSVAHINSQDFTPREDFPSIAHDLHVEVQAYCARDTGRLRILVHEFNGRIRIFETDLVDLIDPNLACHQFDHRCTWSGHSSPIEKIVRNYSGRSVVSRTADGESVVWTHSGGRATSGLSRQSVVPEAGHIHRICVLRKGRFVVFLKHGTISVWDCRRQKAIAMCHQPYELSGKPLCLLILPRQHRDDYRTVHIATITSEQKGIVWQLDLPPYMAPDAASQGGSREATLMEFCRFELQNIEGLAYVLPVDPAGSSPITTGFLDVFAKDVAISYTQSGRVDFWTARIDNTDKRVEWLSTCCSETGLANPALVSGSTLKKAALVDSSRSQLSIWDIGGARLEFSQDYEAHHTIRDLDWTSTPDSQSILAVGFQHRVVLLSQMRFDYLNKGPAWAPIREISIRELTPHPIGDSAWLGDGHLVVGAGNQMLIYGRNFGLADSKVSTLRLPQKKDGVWDLFEAVQRLNGPLPIFHPQFLSQCILAGKTTLVHRILLALHQTFKYHIPGEQIDDYLGMELDMFYMDTVSSKQVVKQQSDSYLNRGASDDPMQETFTEDVAAAINERLTKVGLPQLSGQEQMQLADIIECVGLVDKHRRSLDEDGARFMLFLRQHALRKGRMSEINISWREIVWAFHSGSQDILVDFVIRQYHGSLLWESARESGMFMWLTDTNAMKAQFEIIARNEYTKSEMKNPIDCSLYYLALKKKTVLQGLWRMASWNKEQGATQRLLANNFEDPKWRTTALKNAYALLSKRRFEYAAAFFLLADHLTDAVNVCLHQLKDLQLAIAIARVYEGDSGPVLRKLLEDEVLNVAAREGNRWLASWAFWMLGRKDMAVRSLITPVYTLLETPVVPDLRSKLFLTDDPALVVLYSQLRQKTLQTLRGASKVTPRIEWEFVLHSAKLFDRMGCDLLGLDLVRNWEFPQPTATVGALLGGEANPLKLLRRRSSLVVDDMPFSSLRNEVRMAESGKGQSGRHQPPPTMFEEPDSSSLLDSFGF
ncbi:regulator of V-ATPase in vacuolar membrane protein [Verticillium dahliae VdLs.17]|uniref:Regulator of V-ATPase in vacuolar membrane protein n=2 Tax=Verticillium dahliae TaxID=27337 RepID=G2X1E4_VERDV|nr:regulator of V-ATPase in vacuolar membrane protein [Verticillium dahliae VdLs.17]EGY22635.1 regulator of V-ATPase in vacuolar membrane protein [Verticillium dahliae VdLs.17]KAH6705067.1 regulator of V-ATPase in vacuolar membrane protein [Verticillium dahliae]